jgi:hypothetical protein
MKYEEWIKYEEIRQNQPDKFAWIASPELTTGMPLNNHKPTALPTAGRQPKKNLWMLIFHRFISRRI